MKKIFLLLSFFVAFNAFTTSKVIAFHQCSDVDTPNGWEEIRKCVNEFLEKDFEIIGYGHVWYPAINRVINGQNMAFAPSITMALIEKNEE